MVFSNVQDPSINSLNVLYVYLIQHGMQAISIKYENSKSEFEW